MNYRRWKGGKNQPEISTTFGFKANIQAYTQIGRLIEGYEGLQFGVDRVLAANERDKGKKGTLARASERRAA